MGKDKFVHGPVGVGKCIVCHGELPKHLKRPKWNKFKKVENSSKLCFTCHEQFKPKKFIHKALQEGDCVACHSPHGSPNKYQLVAKGGDLCRACHETHAGNYPKHIRDSVPFGKWELPLNFEKTDTGGSCTPGCHQLKKYDRVKFEENL